MDFTPDSEDEVIRGTVSHKLDRYLVNTSNKFWRDSAQNKAPNLPFQVDDSLRCTNQGQNEMVELVEVNTNDPYSIKYINKFLRGNKMVVSQEFLKSSNVPDVVPITISSEDYINECNNLTQ